MPLFLAGTQSLPPNVTTPVCRGMGIQDSGRRLSKLLVRAWHDTCSTSRPEPYAVGSKRALLGKLFVFQHRFRAWRLGKPSVESLFKEFLTFPEGHVWMRLNEVLM